VTVVDPDTVEIVNLASQEYRALDAGLGAADTGSSGARGSSKASAVVNRCDEIEPGRAVGLCCDVRHVGVGEFRRFELIVDATDDPDLAYPLTLISNGIGVPLLRVAVDGTGAMELGRVLTSTGGDGHACQICHYSARDLRPRGARLPCPGNVGTGPNATLAGGALGMSVAGLAVLQAQRMVGGNHLESVVNREIVLDLSRFEIHALQLERSDRCLSGHVTWDVISLQQSVSSTSLGDLFRIGRERLGPGVDLGLEPFLHPLCVAARCPCGRWISAIGSVWAEPPRCPACGQASAWSRELLVPSLSERQAAELGVRDRSLSSLGLPSSGALVLARAMNGVLLPLLLDSSFVDSGGDHAA
jgi:hypothetical protein